MASVNTCLECGVFAFCGEDCFVWEAPRIELKWEGEGGVDLGCSCCCSLGGAVSDSGENSEQQELLRVETDALAEMAGML